MNVITSLIVGFAGEFLAGVTLHFLFEHKKEK